jgi:hypothetical protein
MLYNNRKNAKKDADTITITKEEYDYLLNNARKATNRENMCQSMKHCDCMKCTKLIKTPYTCYCEDGYKTQWELMR